MRLLRLGSSAATLAIGSVCASCFLDTAGHANAGGAAASASSATTATGSGTGGATTASGGTAGEGGEAGTGGGTGGSPASSSAASSAGSTGSGPLPTCGDDNVDPGETCDDGNSAAGDGCSSACEDEDVCPGSMTVLGLGDSVTILGNTNAGTNGGNSSGCSGYGASSTDLVFGVQTAAEGTLTVSYAASYNGHIYVRTKCDDESSEVACDSSDQTILSIPASGGSTHYVWIDGGNSEAGPFTLTVGLSP